jgi:hypothetical protein
MKPVSEITHSEVYSMLNAKEIKFLEHIRDAREIYGHWWALESRKGFSIEDRSCQSVALHHCKTFANVLDSLSLSLDAKRSGLE